MPKIALSYRRKDSPAMAGRINDQLVSRYGEAAVFMDIESIPYGVDFRDQVDEVLRNVDILLAIVGPQWRGVEADGRSRLHDETDFVRIEIETALKRGIPVVPVLVDGATMPEPALLPDVLKPFSFRNAAEIESGRDFKVHMERLIRSMDRHFERIAMLPEAKPAPVTQPIADSVGAATDPKHFAALAPQLASLGSAEAPPPSGPRKKTRAPALQTPAAAHPSVPARGAASSLPAHVEGYALRPVLLYSIIPGVLTAVWLAYTRIALFSSLYVVDIVWITIPFAFGVVHRRAKPGTSSALTYSAATGLVFLVVWFVAMALYYGMWSFNVSLFFLGLVTCLGSLAGNRFQDFLLGKAFCQRRPCGCVRGRGISHPAFHLGRDLAASAAPRTRPLRSAFHRGHI